MSFNKSFSGLKFDKRMRDWNVKQGFLTEEEYKAHLESLNDLQDECVLLSIEDESSKSTDSSTDIPAQEEIENIEENPN